MNKKEIDKILLFNKKMLYLGLFSVIVFIITLFTYILNYSIKDETKGLLFLIILLSGLLSLILILISIIDYIRINKFKKFGIDFVRSEVEKDSTIYYRNCRVAITDNYIFTMYHFIPIKDIVWIYIETIVPATSELIVVTESLKRYTIGTSNNSISFSSLTGGVVGGFEGIESLEKVIKNIKKKNRNILVGKTKENKKKVFEKNK